MCFLDEVIYKRPDILDSTGDGIGTGSIVVIAVVVVIVAVAAFLIVKKVRENKGK